MRSAEQRERASERAREMVRERKVESERAIERERERERDLDFRRLESISDGGPTGGGRFADALRYLALAESQTLEEASFGRESVRNLQQRAYTPFDE